MNKLKNSHVCVIGCGGLGGYIIEMLARVGVGKITVADGDVFDITNLNRQILSTADNLGASKAYEAAKRVRAVNPEVSIRVVDDYVGINNGESIVKDAALVMDAIDTISARMMLQSICESANVPMVHGAIAGWCGHVTTIFPGDKTLNQIYEEGFERGIEKEVGNPSFTPALVASVQVSEAIKLLTGKGTVLKKQLMLIDLGSNEFHMVSL